MIAFLKVGAVLGVLIFVYQAITAAYIAIDGRHGVGLGIFLRGCITLSLAAVAWFQAKALIGDVERKIIALNAASIENQSRFLTESAVRVYAVESRTNTEKVFEYKSVRFVVTGGGGELYNFRLL